MPTRTDKLFVRSYHEGVIDSAEQAIHFNGTNVRHLQAEDCDPNYRWGVKMELAGKDVDVRVAPSEQRSEYPTKLILTSNEKQVLHNGPATDDALAKTSVRHVHGETKKQFQDKNDKYIYQTMREKFVFREPQGHRSVMQRSRTSFGHLLPQDRNKRALAATKINSVARRVLEQRRYRRVLAALRHMAASKINRFIRRSLPLLAAQPVNPGTLAVLVDEVCDKMLEDALVRRRLGQTLTGRASEIFKEDAKDSLLGQATELFQLAQNAAPQMADGADGGLVKNLIKINRDGAQKPRKVWNYGFLSMVLKKACEQVQEFVEHGTFELDISHLSWKPYCLELLLSALQPIIKFAKVLHAESIFANLDHSEGRRTLSVLAHGMKPMQRTKVDQLKTVNLSHNAIGTVGFPPLRPFFAENHRIEEVRLVDCGLQGHASALARWLTKGLETNSSLAVTDMSLSENKFDLEGCIGLQTVLTVSPKITTLLLQDAIASCPEGACRVLQGLDDGNTKLLQCLYLSSTLLPESIAFLRHVLRRCSDVKTLALTESRLGDMGMRRLVEVMKDAEIRPRDLNLTNAFGEPTKKEKLVAAQFEWGKILREAAENGVLSSLEKLDLSCNDSLCGGQGKASPEEAKLLFVALARYCGKLKFLNLENAFLPLDVVAQLGESKLPSLAGINLLNNTVDKAMLEQLATVYGDIAEEDFKVEVCNPNSEDEEPEDDDQVDISDSCVVPVVSEDNNDADLGNAALATSHGSEEGTEQPLASKKAGGNSDFLGI